MKRAVIFDLDGLLINSECVIHRIYSDLTERYGQELSLEEYAQNYSGKTGKGNMETLIRTYHLPISVPEGLRFVSEREAEYHRAGVALKDGARELLDHLRGHGYTIVLASSSTRERAEDILRQNRILSYFDEMVFGAEVAHGKPYPDIFKKACEKAQARPSECLVLEDSEAGIQAAFFAGVDVICVPDLKPPRRLCRSMTRAVLPSLRDVIPILGEQESA